MGDPYYDPYQDMGEGDMMAMYAQMNPQLFGNDPAKRLNYYQDLMSTLGTDLVQTAGVSNPAAEQYQAPMNQTGAIYGSDQLYASIFQAIENDVDPISAAKAAKDQGLFKGTQEDFNAQVVSIATQYAAERVKNQQDQMSWEAKNGGGWSMPDGSKYKQTPLGGNDVRATASEFDLLGAPDSQALFDQYASARMAKPKMIAGAGVSASAGPAASNGFGWTAGASPKADAFNQAVAGVPAEFWDGAAPKASGSKIQPRNVGAPALAGGDFFANKTAKDSINARVNQSKNTQVRSDANRNLMRRITALAGLLQGGFPE